MKVVKLTLCVALILSTVGCATNRESVITCPAQPAASSQTAETIDCSQSEKVAQSRPHPIRDKMKNAAQTAAVVVAAPFLLTFILIMGGIPMSC